ncbi:MAG: DegT/DnrJ/EryC1/StrS family aminotransferase [bacterium]
MPVPFFDLKIQNSNIRKEIDAAISAVVDSAHFILGTNVAELEKEAAAYHNAKYAVGVASGTDALHLALKAAGIKENDEVITTPFTFVATAEVISYIGAKPVFVDIDPGTFNIDPAKIKEKINKRTKAVIPVHLFGQAADMDGIMAIANDNGIKVIEDSCQAIGAKYHGKHVSTIGDAGCISFFPTKNLGGFGDGGMIITNNEEIYNTVKVLRGHGSRITYHYDMVGYNSRLDEIQAAVLRVKLKHLESYMEARRKNAVLYNQLLAGIVETPKESPNVRHVYNQYTIKTADRNKLQEFLKSKGIGAMVYYPLALHLQKVYEHLGYKKASMPHCEKAQDEVLSLPIFPELTQAQVNEVASAIKEFFKK